MSGTYQSSSGKINILLAKFEKDLSICGSLTETDLTSQVNWANGNVG